MGISPTTQPKPNPRADEAFDEYVDLGPGRSLTILAALYRSRADSVPTRQLSRLKIWSTKYHWQARLSVAVTERSEVKLTEAAELDTDTFLVTSRLLNERAHLTTALDTDHVVKVRESVRKPMPKGGAVVSVNVSVEIRQLAEQLAKAAGIDDVEGLIREAEEIAMKAGAGTL